MNKTIFNYDPVLGCPFDDSEMTMVESWKGFMIGHKVEFRRSNIDGPLIQGKITAIGVNAKTLDGDPFVAFAIHSEKGVCISTHRHIWHVL